MKAFLAFALLLVGTSSLAKDVTREFSTEGLKKLVVGNRTGRLLVEASKDDKARVVAKKTNFTDACYLTMKRDGNRLAIQVEKDGLFSDGDCQVDLTVQVPKNVALNLNNGSGNVEVRDTLAPVELKVGRGDVKLDAGTEDLKVTTGFGKISAVGLKGNAELKSGRGDVSVIYPKAPKAGEIEIKLGLGNATVFLPSNAEILSDYASGSGRVYNEVGDSKEARFKVTMRAGKGDLNIKEIE